MPITAIEGVVENGKIRLREPVSLAENTRVYVIIADSLAKPSIQVRSPRLANPAQARELRKKVLEFPGDAEL